MKIQQYIRVDCDIQVGRKRNEERKIGKMQLKKIRKLIATSIRR